VTRYARCEALAAIIETFPALRRAQRIAFACDAHCDAAGLVRGLSLLPDSWGGSEDTLTDGRGSRHALVNELRHVELPGAIA
jgi:hypothetical protein